jgi:hypothetical protein
MIYSNSRSDIRLDGLTYLNDGLTQVVSIGHACSIMGDPRSYSNVVGSNTMTCATEPLGRALHRPYTVRAYLVTIN